MVLTGTYEHTIDAKNRLAIPSEIRNRIQRSVGVGEGDSIAMYITPGLGDRLCLYTEAGFEKRAEELDHSDADPDEIAAYEEVFYTLSQRIELDSAGRVRLPEALIQRAGLGKEVVLLGVKDHLQVRDRETWKAHVDTVLEKNPKLLVNPRLAMKRGIRRERGDANGAS